MTDKQIIIDASKCEWRTGVEHCGNYECMLNKCCDYNCDWYKRRKLEQQLKAKEQECERLGHTYLETNELLQDKTKALTNLKSENDGLKTMLKDLSYENQKFCYQIEEQTKQLEPFKDEYFKGLDNVAIAKLAKKSIRITAENSKLEQTLTEIKEICNSVENIENINSLYDAKLSGMYLQANKILQKISECEI